MFIEYLGRAFIGLSKPIVLDDTAPGGPESYVFAAYALIMFILSLKREKTI